MWQRKNSDGAPLTPAQLLQKAEAYCSKAEHCPQEVRDKLHTWGADRQQTDDIIDSLTGNRFLSEERYCRAFVHDKVLFQGWGREKIRAALGAKRLPAATVQEALDTFPEEDYTQTLRRVAEQKKRQLATEPDEDTRRTKLLQHLLSRGFTYKEIMSDIESQSLS